MHTFHSVLEDVKSKYPHQPTFIQAVEEVVGDLEEFYKDADSALVDRFFRLTSPERVITFKINWTDDSGKICTNTGYRVQFNSALGSYKGGLRFDESVNEDILKFLGFEQTFKNALTGLPLGGGKGGSDFNPKGKSENEIRNFCRAFMIELHSHIGIDKDVPAGDMGVSGREIGYMMGMYKELTHSSEGVLTGKDPLIGGSLGRTEATGHGVVYFARAMLAEKGESLSGMRAVVSGSGNVAEHTARKLVNEGAVVLTLSDRSGYLYKDSGLTISDIDLIMFHKDTGASLDSCVLEGAEFKTGKPWQSVKASGYFPCATQNEVNEEDARAMSLSAKIVVEGANMPLTSGAVAVFRKANIAHAPGKASNAGGVAVSGLEMAQNASHYPWSRERVEEELVNIMESIHAQCKEAGKTDWGIDYVKGANIAGAKRVLAAMERLGW